MTLTRRSIAAAFGLLMVLGLAGTANAQPYPPTDAQCSQTKNDAGNPSAVFSQGATMTVDSQNGCATAGANTVVDLESAPVRFCSTTANASGRYSCTEKIPSNFPAGDHFVVVTTSLNGSTRVYRNIITVQAAGGVTLPTTGTDAALLALWAVGLIVFGSLLVSATWKHFRAVRAEAALTSDRRLPTVDMPAGFTPTMTTWRDRSDDDDDFADDAVTSTDDGLSYAPASAEDTTAPADVEEAASRVSERTSDVVTRLREQIRSWGDS